MRFPEFDGEWEKYNVSDILNTFPTNSLSWDNLSYKCGKIKNIHYGLIHNGFDTTCVYTTNKIIPFIKDGNFPLKYTLLKTGDLILADASENRKDVGRPIEIINDICENIISGLHTIHARDKSNIAVQGFKGFYFQSKSMKSQIYRIANGSKIYGISPSNFKELHMCLPDHLEQEKIVALLRKIETRIQTQSKIISDYESQKKSIINKYLSEYSISWNKYQLNEILIEHNDYKIKNENIIHATLSKDGINPKTERYDRDFLVKDENKKYKVTYYDDICYNPANLKFGVITRNNFGTCIISPIYITYNVNNNFDPKFIELLVTNSEFIKKARKYEQGTVYERMSVNSSDLLSIHVLVPSLIEQKKFIKIVETFIARIVNEKELLNLYENQKKYLLKNMFI